MVMVRVKVRVQVRIKVRVKVTVEVRIEVRVDVRTLATFGHTALGLGTSSALGNLIRFITYG